MTMNANRYFRQTCVRVYTYTPQMYSVCVTKTIPRMLRISEMERRYESNVRTTKMCALRVKSVFKNSTCTECIESRPTVEKSAHVKIAPIEFFFNYEWGRYANNLWLISHNQN